MVGIHKVAAPTRIARLTTNEIIDYLGGDSNDAQIDATKILLAQGGSLLSTWRLAADLTKMDAVKVAGDLAAAQMQTNVLAAIIAAGGINRADVALPHHRKAFRAYASGATTLTKSTFTKVLFATEEFDLDSVFASSTYTPGEVGYYLVGGGIEVDGCEATTRLIFSIFKNASEGSRITDFYVDVAANPQISSCVLVYLGNATDYLELQIYHNNSVNKNSAVGQHLTYFWGFEL